ncbi:MAG TPA: sensor histidine kinase [Anaerolineae bacterium]|nr:sensor histidine kinase [Anaerolineae bacterium]HID84079.1 sensor histidine kinase [Anaerolineales bacterium]HIQ08330.1 sensor histidine kinase [Anaerolineaceae bacterium]
MTALRDWFEANRLALLFFYGQVFFTMGVAVAVQSRRHSRLALARGLPWLAVFGFFHAFYLWGEPLVYLFQVAGTHEGTELIMVLKTLQVLFLGGSFGALLQFGLILMRPLPERWAWLDLTGMALFSTWLIMFYLGLSLGIDLSTWQQWLNVLARYGLGLPGALVAAWGLRIQAKRHLVTLELDFIYSKLRYAGIALLLFAVLIVALAPPLPVFPANWINAQIFSRGLYLPAEVALVVVSVAFAMLTIRVLEVFNIETQRLLDQMEQAQIVAIERERIARELHDGALQHVYAAGLLARSLCRCVENPNSVRQIERLWEALDKAIQELRRFLSTLHAPSREGNTDVHRVLASLAEDAARISGTDIAYHGEPVQVSPEKAAHLVSFAREALSNAIRHARTPFIQVRLQKQDDRLVLIVEDQGVGLPPHVKRGYGLRNMEDRARLLGGTVRFESQPGKGTRVVLSVPLSELQPASGKEDEA